MTALLISISSEDGKRFKVQCDNMRREDATDAEIAMANLFERFEMGFIKEVVADKIIEMRQTQTGPGAMEAEDA